MKKIGLVHATMNSVQPILESFRSLHPEVEIINVMDESLIKELNKTNIITNHMVRRLIDIAGKADNADVDGILFTCSSFSPYVPKIKHLFSVPTLSADESMLQQAVQTGKNIGVIATVAKAAPTTTSLLYEQAAKQSKEVNIETILATDAFLALQNGDTAKHDDIIHKHINEVASQNDVLVLAQFSMARAVRHMKSDMTSPILTSPEASCRAIVNLVTQKGRGKHDKRDI